MRYILKFLFVPVLWEGRGMWKHPSAGAVSVIKKWVCVMKSGVFLTFACVCAAACNIMAESDDPAQKVTLPPTAVPIIYADYVLVQGTIENIPARLLLDTGAEDLLLDSLFKSNSRLDYEHFFPASITGIGNSSQKIIIITDPVRIGLGSDTFRATPVPVLNIKPIGGDIIDGLLGKAFFSDAVLELDYDQRYINILPDLDSFDLASYQKVGIRRTGNFCCAPVTIRISEREVIRGDFILDTGSPTSTIASSTAFQNKLDSVVEEKVRYYTEYGGIGGESSSFEFITEAVSLADFVLTDVNMSFSLDEEGVLSEGDYLGIIGNNILDRFDLLFDFENNYLYLRPNSSYGEPYVFDRLGFTWVDRCRSQGSWIVSGLTESSRAEQEGLMINDRITHVNGTPVEQIPFEEQNDFFRKQKKVKLVVMRGGEELTIRFTPAPILLPD